MRYLLPSTPIAPRRQSSTIVAVPAARHEWALLHAAPRDEVTRRASPAARRRMIRASMRAVRWQDRLTRPRADAAHYTCQCFNSHFCRGPCARISSLPGDDFDHEAARDDSPLPFSPPPHGHALGATQAEPSSFVDAAEMPAHNARPSIADGVNPSQNDRAFGRHDISLIS